MDTINRLLKKQAPKRRGRAGGDAGAGGDGVLDMQEPEVEKAPPTYVRWINNSQGSKLAIPEEWLDAPVSQAFGVSGIGPGASFGGVVVQGVSGSP